MGICLCCLSLNYLLYKITGHHCCDRRNSLRVVKFLVSELGLYIETILLRRNTLCCRQDMHLTKPPNSLMSSMTQTMKSALIFQPMHHANFKLQWCKESCRTRSLRLTRYFWFISIGVKFGLFPYKKWLSTTPLKLASGKRSRSNPNTYN